MIRTRNALQTYGGLWDVARCRKAIERLPGELRAAGFDPELLEPFEEHTKEVVRTLRRV
ncbi:MAG: hypothetical protein KDA91_14890 [Planctomycetaceae bacterium]|nr:hypothetical protein [Planctomycetaceae bacterium]